MSDTLTQGQRIRMLRLKKRFTLEFVAQSLKTTRQAIHKYEADIVKKIPTDKLILLSNLFNCSLAYLQCESDDDTPPSTHQTSETLFTPLPTLNINAKDINNDFLSFYHEFMDTVTQLSPENLQSVLQFAKFLAQNKN